MTTDYQSLRITVPGAVRCCCVINVLEQIELFKQRNVKGMLQTCQGIVNDLSLEGVPLWKLRAVPSSGTRARHVTLRRLPGATGPALLLQEPITGPDYS